MGFNSRRLLDAKHCGSQKTDITVTCSFNRATQVDDAPFSPNSLQCRSHTFQHTATHRKPQSFPNIWPSRAISSNSAETLNGMFPDSARPLCSNVILWHIEQVILHNPMLFA